MRKISKTSKKMIFSIFIILLIGSSYSPFPNSIKLTLSKVQAEETSFAFDVNNLQNNGNFNNEDNQITGSYSLISDTTLTVSVTDITDPANPKDLTSSFMDNHDNTWTFSGKFPDGSHKITFKANDGTNTITKEVSFKVDTKRPVVTSYNLISNDHIGNSKPWNDSIIEDMTHVPLDVAIQIKIKESNKVKYKLDKDGNILNPIVVKAKNTTNIVSKEDQQNPPESDGNGNYLINFTPKVQLAPNTTYYVYITNNIVDESGNSVSPKMFKFTTTNGNEANNPHGHYANNTSMCGYCHSTHNGSTPSLEGGLLTDLEKRKEVYPNLPSDPSKSYCLSCHDGTMNAPLVNNIDKDYQHNNPANYTDDNSVPDTLAQTNSCTTCHNPHSDWTASNPNLLKNHDIFTSNKGAVAIDGLDVTCEACHAENPEIDITKYQGHDSQILSYKKSLTAVGDINGKITDPTHKTVADYSLCLRCHNSKNENGAKDIESYFTNQSSGHFIALPNGKSTQDDGSKLNGPFPCAECHDTHGSDNMKMLRTQLGNVNTTENQFVASGSTWDAANERKFCLTCHNGSTELYGKVVPVPPLSSTGSPSGHKPTSTSACSGCHGTGTGAEKFLSAAHSPRIR
jgi:hypothetical protein